LHISIHFGTLPFRCRINTELQTRLSDNELDQIVTSYKRLELEVPQSLNDSKISRLKERKENLLSTQKQKLDALVGVIEKMESEL